MTDQQYTPEQLNPIVENIRRQVSLGITPTEAAKHLEELLGDPAKLRAGLAEYLKRVGAIRWLREPATLEEPGLPTWYPGACESDDCNWPALKRVLTADHWEAEDIDSLGRASDKILSRLPPPGQASFHSRGLVLGYVQSGKTANYTALIAKAADMNYRLFIVLSGVHEGLRRQTQERLEDQLCRPMSEDWVSLTSTTGDFARRTAPRADFFLTSHHDHRVLVVVKKNQARLRGLIAWLRAARPNVLAACPILVIDDEADQASVNASLDAAGRTRINDLIIELIQVPPKVAYVGYTATPFANLLIDPSNPADLYPRDFIVDLPRPEDYFGPERVFGRERLTQEEGDSIDGLDMIRRIPDAEVDLIKPAGRDRDGWTPTLAPSLAVALDYFVLASAARLARGQRDFTSMLIHTSMYTDLHRSTLALVGGWLTATRDEITRGDTATVARLRSLWEAETDSVPAEDAGEQATDFDALRPHIRAVVDTIELVRDDYESQDRLDYEGDPRPVIVIGGNTLSRGLTLKGLIVSYFVRTASAYDTLLQMGRWFGYRRGYSDLPRVWMTEELENYFHDLATVEHEIREDIKLYEIERTTPTEFAVRIRTHPALGVTARSKMQHAIECFASYSGRRPQMTLYRRHDPTWLGGNRQAAWTLLERAIAETGAIETAGNATLVRDVGVSAILEFIDAYRFHDRADEMRAPLLRGYIHDQSGLDSLLRWNVAVVGRGAKPDDRLLEIGPGISVPLLNRSALRDRTDAVDADLGSLMSKADLALDLALSPAEVAPMSTAALMARRSGDQPNVGLLLLYPIARDSEPQRESNTRSRVRIPLDADDDVVGVAFAFPRASNMTPQRYVSANLEHVEREEPDLPEPEDAEADQVVAEAYPVIAEG